MSDPQFKDPKDFKCQQCGKCCISYYDVSEITFTDQDYQRFIGSDQPNILEYIESIPIGNGQFIHDGWFTPKTGMEVDRCPWLRKLPNKNKYKCKIYELRPDVCRAYPQIRQKKDAIKNEWVGWAHLGE